MFRERSLSMLTLTGDFTSDIIILAAIAIIVICVKLTGG